MIGVIVPVIVIGIIGLFLMIASKEQAFPKTGKAPVEEFPSKMIKAFYNVFLGLLLTMVITTGVMAFYPIPREPNPCYT